MRLLRFSVCALSSATRAPSDGVSLIAACFNVSTHTLLRQELAAEVAQAEVDQQADAEEKPNVRVSGCYGRMVGVWGWHIRTVGDVSSAPGGVRYFLHQPSSLLESIIFLLFSS